MNFNPLALALANLRRFLDRACSIDKPEMSKEDMERFSTFLKKHKIPLAIRCTLYRRLDGTFASTNASFEILVMERLPKSIEAPLTNGQTRDWYVLHVPNNMTDALAWIYQNGYKDNPTLFIPA